MRGRLLFAFLALPIAVGAAAPTPPRTPWGDPDLQGIWNYATMTPLERPREFASKNVLTAEEAAAYEQQTVARQAATNNTAGPDWWDAGTRRLVDRRTSLIVDPDNGRLPLTTEEAKARAAARAARPRGGLADGPEDLGLNVRCIMWAIAGPPLLPGVYNNNVQFVQTRDYVAIVSEMIHDARIVPIDGRPHGTVRRWMGDSRGHWEGATLVVDTINFSERRLPRRRRAPAPGRALHARRRRHDRISLHRRGSDNVDAAVDGGVSAAAEHEPMYEYACHEGNARSVEGILRASAVQRVPD